MPVYFRYYQSNRLQIANFCQLPSIASQLFNRAVDFARKTRFNPLNYLGPNFGGLSQTYLIGKPRGY